MLKFFKLGFARTRHSSGSPALRKPSARLRVARMPRARLVRCAGCTWARPFTYNIQAASNSSQAARANGYPRRTAAIMRGLWSQFQTIK